MFGSGEFRRIQRTSNYFITRFLSAPGAFASFVGTKEVIIAIYHKQYSSNLLTKPQFPRTIEKIVLINLRS